MEFKLHALPIHELGQRQNQEDSIYPAKEEIKDTQRLFILCDGMGGHASGEVASATVCEAMSKTINQALEAGETFTDQLFLKALDAAYDLLDERDTNEPKKMGTTMTFLMLHEEGATIAHIGDSRVYQIRPQADGKATVIFKTWDHSLVNDMLKIGEITEEEAENYPQKNVITRCMQPHQDYRRKADIHNTKNIRPGDYFYMCSDGMLEQTSDDNLCFMLNYDNTDEAKIQMLIKNSEKNHDNHTAHLIHILDVQPESEIEDDPTPALPNAVEEEDDEDVVSPEFENNEETENTESTAVEGGAATTSAPFPRKPETDEPARRSHRAMWGVITILTIAILAVCGYFFADPIIEKVRTFLPQEEVADTLSTEPQTPATAPERQDTVAPAETPDTVTTTAASAAPAAKPNNSVAPVTTTSQQPTGNNAGNSTPEPKEAPPTDNSASIQPQTQQPETTSDDKESE